jgi:hypothetical protein
MGDLILVQSIRSTDSTVRPEGAGPTLLELAARLKLRFRAVPP